MFRHVNDTSNLIFMWDKYSEKWGYLTETRLMNNFRYCDLWQLKHADEEIVQSIISLRYKRVIKTFGKTYDEYVYLKRQKRLMEEWN